MLGRSLLLILCSRALTLEVSRYAPKDEETFKLGVTNKFGVTRFSYKMPKKTPSAGQYYWPSSGGRVGRYGTSHYSGPTDLVSNLSWSWHHPKGKYNTIPVGSPLLDDQMNIIIASDDAVRKFDVMGHPIWAYATRGGLAAAPAMIKGGLWNANETRDETTMVYQGRNLTGSTPQLFGTTQSGFVFAIDLETGEEKFATKACTKISGVKGSVGSYGHVLVAATNECGSRYCNRHRNRGNSVVRGLSVVDGRGLWSFTPDAPVWNFVPLFPQDLNDSVLFQDYEGGTYCLNFKTGALKWKQGGSEGSFTDATAGIGANGAVYSVFLNGPDSPWSSGVLRGFDIKDGRQLWQRKLPMPLVGSPVVGRLNSGAGRYSVVVGLGQACNAGAPTQLWALDAKLGSVQWTRSGPTNPTPFCAGDREGFAIRNSQGSRPICTPNAWTNPMIDANGFLFVGNQIGTFYRIGAPNGTAADVTYLSQIETGSAFQDTSIALAPGMMVVSGCDTLHVFRA